MPKRVRKTLPKKFNKGALNIKNQGKQYLHNNLGSMSQQGQNFMQQGQNFMQQGQNFMQQGQNFMQQDQNFMQQDQNFMQQPNMYYRPQSYYPQYRQPAMASAYNYPGYPPPQRQVLGSLEKKMLVYTFVFIIAAIIIIIITRVLVTRVDGYIHSCTGYHCKKGNHYGTGKKHDCNGGYGTHNKGHNKC